MKRVLTLVAGAVIVSVPIVPAHAAEPAPIPERQVSSFRAVVLDTGEVNIVWWSGHDRIGTKVVGTHAAGARSVVSGATEGFFTPGERASIIRRRYVAAPDGGSIYDPLLVDGLASLWARHRDGKPVFTKARVGGAPSLRARVPIARNACSGDPSGVRIIDLQPRTLLPLRITTKLRGQRQEVTRYRYANLNRAQPRGAVRLGGGVGRPRIDNDGFRRTSPRAATARLGYTPSLPRDLPDGFRRKVSGWAPRGRMLGAEGTIPPRPKLFAALYARGVERIDLTIRRAAPGDWIGSPLGRECRPLSEAKTTVRGFPATYAISHEIPPHLYWREGRLLYTLVGPFPKETLREIAESMAPVSGPAA
jgi:hypothetical protein